LNQSATDGVLIYDIVIRKQIPGASLQRGFSTLNSSYVISMNYISISLFGLFA